MTDIMERYREWEKQENRHLRNFAIVYCGCVGFLIVGGIVALIWSWP